MIATLVGRPAFPLRAHKASARRPD